MRIVVIILALASVLASCGVNAGKRVKGNGHITTESRDVADADKIRIRGNFQVELVPGSPSLKIEADENLLRYIVTKKEDGWLVIRSRDNYNLRSNRPIKIYLSVNDVEAIHIAGSGTVLAKGKFDGASKLDVDIAGSGEVDMNVNTPVVTVDISGSGDVRLSGETRDATIDISGAGHYDARHLLTEKTNVDITGSGEATVHADVHLDAEITGSGNVYYRGKADIKSRTTGSGRIARLD